MPLCPQITNTPITVVQNSDFVVSSVVPVVVANTQQVAVVQQSAADAYAEAVAAGTAASTAQTTADGKNKVTYSTSTPGSTANAIGDIWYQYGTSAPNVGRIIAQYMGAGGTSWTQTTVSGLVIANIDAGSITTGTLSVALGITTGTGTFTVNALTGAMYADSATITGTITGGVVQTSSGGTAVVMEGSTNSIGFKNGGTYSGFITPIGAGAVIMHYGTTPSATGYPRTSVSSTTASLAANGSNSLSITTTGNNMVGDMNFLNYVKFTQSVDVMKAFNAFDEIYAIFGAATTVTNTPNTWMSTSGQIRRSTSSSIRYKDNVTNLVDIDELHPKKLLDLPVRAFTYKEEYLSASDDRYQQLFPGFIAEEVDAIYPMAADYEKGNVESWNDRILIPGMLALIQDLYKEIATLKGE